MPSEKSRISSASVSKVSLSPNPSSKLVRSINLTTRDAPEVAPVRVSSIANVPSTLDSSISVSYTHLTLPTKA